MGTKQLIIYAEGSGALRRMIIDDDDNLVGEEHIRRGEQFVLVEKPSEKNPLGGYVQPDLNWARAVVAHVRGKEASEPRAALLDAGGVVQKIVMADAALDRSADKELVAAGPATAEGDMYDKDQATFTAPEKPQEVGPRARDAAKAEPAKGDA